MGNGLFLLQLKIYANQSNLFNLRSTATFRLPFPCFSCVPWLTKNPCKSVFPISIGTAFKSKFRKFKQIANFAKSKRIRR